MKLRVGINTRHLADGEMRGFARYTLNLLRELANSGDLELVLFSDRPLHTHFRHLFRCEEVCFTSRREVLWEQWELPKRLLAERIDVFHAPANRGLPFRRVCPYVLTLHDIVERLPGFKPGGPLKSRLRQAYADFVSVGRADAIVTVSRYSKDDICRFWRVPSERVHVTYGAPDPIFHERLSRETVRAVRERLRLPERYLLCLAGFDPKKNIKGLVQAYARASEAEVPPLVLAGEPKWEFASVQALTEALGLGRRVIFPGRIPEAELPALYQGALAVVVASVYEGFPLPTVEAMASGVPVVASNRTATPEVLGGAGLLFDPGNPEELAECLRQVSVDAALRERLRNAGAARAAEFSWARTAAETLAVYRRITGRG